MNECVETSCETLAAFESHNDRVRRQVVFAERLRALVALREMLDDPALDSAMKYKVCCKIMSFRFDDPPRGAAHGASARTPGAGAYDPGAGAYDPGAGAGATKRRRRGSNQAEHVTSLSVDVESAKQAAWCVSEDGVTSASDDARADAPIGRPCEMVRPSMDESSSHEGDDGRRRLVAPGEGGSPSRVASMDRALVHDKGALTWQTGMSALRFQAAKHNVASRRRRIKRSSRCVRAAAREPPRP